MQLMTLYRFRKSYTVEETLHMAKHSRGKPFAVRIEINIHGNSFAVAAILNNANELFNGKHLQKNTKPQKFSPSNVAIYDIY